MPTSANDNIWQCCSGGQLDSRFINYAVKVFISLISLLFCMVKLYKPDEGQDTTVWISIISAIIGNFLPNNHTENTQRELQR